MRCAHFEELILDSFDRELAGQERPALDAHLAGCASCRVFLEAQKSLDTALAAGIAAPPLPDGFARQVLSRVDGIPQEPKISSLPEILDFVGYAGLAVAAACLARYLPELTLPESLRRHSSRTRPAAPPPCSLRAAYGSRFASNAAFPCS